MLYSIGYFMFYFVLSLPFIMLAAIGIHTLINEDKGVTITWFLTTALLFSVIFVQMNS